MNQNFFWNIWIDFEIFIIFTQNIILHQNYITITIIIIIWSTKWWIFNSLSFLDNISFKSICNLVVKNLINFRNFALRDLNLIRIRRFLNCSFILSLLRDWWILLIHSFVRMMFFSLDNIFMWGSNVF